VVPQANPEFIGVDDLIAEATLFESGRPTLVVPYIQRPPFKVDHIAICWDGSRPATRAISDALSLLHRAKRVDLISVVGERPLREELPGADMVSHLARHGITAQVRRVPLVEDDVAPAILNYLADSAAELLVMGGYGHSRLREFILGGATRDILRSMTAPVLLSH
jgi:nucleotide-binding universal stress UspA family protein